MEKLLHKYLRNGITFAPEGNNGGGNGGGNGGAGGTNGGAGGGGGASQGANNANAGGDTGDTGDDGGDDDVPIFGSEDDDPDSLAGMKDVFAAFKVEGEEEPGDVDDTEDDTGDGIEGIAPETVTAMDTAVKNAIKQMKISDDAIPADFDASDHQQLRGLLNKTVQQTVAQVMSVVFKPIQLALTHTQNQMSAQMDRKIGKASEGMKATTIVESKVPEINHKEYGAMVRDMDAALRKKGKKPMERAVILRKTLNQMGINIGANRSSSTPNQGGSGSRQVRTGKTALDSFFGKMAAPGK